MSYKQFDGELWTSEQVQHVGGYESLDDLKKLIDNLDQRVASGEWKDIRLEMLYYDYSDSQYMAFVGYRRCTEREKEQFEKRDAAVKKASEARDAAEFVRLQAKFKGNQP